MVFLLLSILISKQLEHMRKEKNQGTNTARISPMLEVEPYIVELIDHLGKMRSPITCRDGLQLANSLLGKKVLRDYAQTKKR